jgi:5-methylcytosine-specific restriction enzyme A
MTREVPEWIGRTDDAKVPPRVRLRIFNAHKGICYLSGRKIVAGDKWELEHVRALILGGEHRESNLAPALSGPHKRKTAMEMAVKSKADDVAKKHLGIKRPKGAIKSAGFPKVAKDSHRTSKSLPPRQLYEER